MHPIDLPELPAQPLVSVLVASYNNGRYVAECIESALQQTYRNVEVVVCDDGSTDNSVEIIEKYVRQDSRVLLFQQPNAGHHAAYNTVYRHSKGDILSILDSDDFYHRTKIEKVVRMFRERPGVGFVIHPLIMVDRDSRYLQPLTVVDKFEEGWIADRIICRGGLWRSMTASGVNFRRELAPYVYPVPNGIWVDVIFNTLLPLVTRVGVIQEYLSYYRRHDTQATREIRNFGSCEEAIYSTRRFLYQVEVAIAATNARIAELKLDVPFIDLGKNFDYRLRTYALQLFTGGSLWQRIQGYVTLIPLVRAHDMYDARTKAILLIAYAATLITPRRLRPRMIEAMHTTNRLKYFFLRRKAKREFAVAPGADLAAK